MLTFSLCSGAEFLLLLVHEAIPDVYFEFGASVPAADLAVHVLDYLHKKLEEMCLVQGGEVVNLFSCSTLCVFTHFSWFMMLSFSNLILITGGSLSHGALHVCGKLVAIY